MEKVYCNYKKEDTSFVMRQKDKLLVWSIPGDDLCVYYINIGSNKNSPFTIYKECDSELYNIFNDIFDGIDNYIKNNKKWYSRNPIYESLLNKEKDTIRYFHDKEEIDKATQLIMKKDDDKIEINFVHKHNFEIIPSVVFHSRHGSRYERANEIFYDKYYEMVKQYTNDKVKKL